MAVRRKAAFSYPRRWSPLQVPTGPFEIDWSHDLSSGLQTLVIPGAQSYLNDIAGNAPPLIAQSGATIAQTSWGPGLSDTASSGGAYVAIGATASKLFLPTAGSIFWAGQCVGSSGLNVTLFGITYATSDTSPYFSYGLFANSNAVDFWVSNNSYFSLPYNYTAALTFGATFTWGGNARSFANGVFQSQSTSIPSPVSNYGSGNALSMGTYPGQPTRVSSSVSAIGAIYDYALPDNLMAWLNAEPFAMLRPVVRRAYFFGPTIVSLSAKMRASGAGKVHPVGSSPLVARLLAEGRARNSLGAQAPLGGVGAAKGRGQALGCGVAPTNALTMGRGAAPATAGGIASLGVRSKSLGRSQAALVGVLRLSSTARTANASTGRSAIALSAQLLARAANGSIGRASAAGVLFLSTAGRSRAASAGRAATVGVASIAARLGAASKGRSALVLLASLSARTKTAGAARAAVNLLASIGGKARSSGAGRVASGSVTQLAAMARAGAANAGRAAAALTSPLIGIAKAGARGRSSARTTAPLTAAARSGARANATSSNLAPMVARSLTAGRFLGAASLLARLSARVAAAATTSRGAPFNVAGLIAAARAGPAGRAGSSSLAPMAGVAWSATRGLAGAVGSASLSGASAAAAFAGVLPGYVAQLWARVGSFGRGASAPTIFADITPAAAGSGRYAAAPAPVRLVEAAALVRLAVADPPTRLAAASEEGSTTMAFSDSAPGATDAYTFDVSAMFPNGFNQSTVQFSSTGPAAWTFGAQSFSGDQITVIATAPMIQGAYTLIVQPTDSVVPGRNPPFEVPIRVTSTQWGTSQGI